jgi:hypothetical protein
MPHGYNFASKFTSIEDLNKRLWVSKVVGVPISKISDSQLESPRNKMTFEEYNTYEGRKVSKVAMCEVRSREKKKQKTNQKKRESIMISSKKIWTMMNPI